MGWDYFECENCFHKARNNYDDDDNDDWGDIYNYGSGFSVCGTIEYEKYEASKCSMFLKVYEYNNFNDALFYYSKLDENGDYIDDGIDEYEFINIYADGIRSFHNLCSHCCREIEEKIKIIIK